jgi:hypothetical protein
MKKIITLLIILSFSFEITGISYAQRTVSADALRPMAAALSGVGFLAESNTSWSVAGDIVIENLSMWGNSGIHVRPATTLNVFFSWITHKYPSIEFNITSLSNNETITPTETMSWCVGELNHNDRVSFIISSKEYPREALWGIFEIIKNMLQDSSFLEQGFRVRDYKNRVDEICGRFIEVSNDALTANQINKPSPKSSSSGRDGAEDGKSIGGFASVRGDEPVQPTAGALTENMQEAARGNTLAEIGSVDLEEKDIQRIRNGESVEIFDLQCERELVKILFPENPDSRLILKGGEYNLADLISLIFHNAVPNAIDSYTQWCEENPSYFRIPLTLKFLTGLQDKGTFIIQMVDNGMPDGRAESTVQKRESRREGKSRLGHRGNGLPVSRSFLQKYIPNSRINLIGRKDQNGAILQIQIPLDGILEVMSIVSGSEVDDFTHPSDSLTISNGYGSEPVESPVTGPLSVQNTASKSGKSGNTILPSTDRAQATSKAPDSKAPKPSSSGRGGQAGSGDATPDSTDSIRAILVDNGLEALAQAVRFIEARLDKDKVPTQGRVLQLYKDWQEEVKSKGGFAARLNREPVEAGAKTAYGIPVGEIRTILYPGCGGDIKTIINMLDKFPYTEEVHLLDECSQYPFMAIKNAFLAFPDQEFIVIDTEQVVDDGTKDILMLEIINKNTLRAVKIYFHKYSYFRAPDALKWLEGGSDLTIIHNIGYHGRLTVPQLSVENIGIYSKAYAHTKKYMYVSVAGLPSESKLLDNLEVVAYQYRPGHDVTEDHVVASDEYIVYKKKAGGAESVPGTKGEAGLELERRQHAANNAMATESAPSIFAENSEDIKLNPADRAQATSELPDSKAPKTSSSGLVHSMIQEMKDPIARSTAISGNATSTAIPIHKPSPALMTALESAA